MADQRKSQKPEKAEQGKGRQQERMGDKALTEEAAKDKDVDRSKTPGQAYDV